MTCKHDTQVLPPHPRYALPQIASAYKRSKQQHATHRHSQQTSGAQLVPSWQTAPPPCRSAAAAADTNPLASEVERVVSEKLAPYQAAFENVQQLASAMDVTNADILDLPPAPVDKEHLLVKMHRAQYESICNTLQGMQSMSEATERLEERVQLLKDVLNKANSKRKADGDAPEGKRACVEDSFQELVFTGLGTFKRRLQDNSRPSSQRTLQGLKMAISTPSPLLKPASKLHALAPSSSQEDMPPPRVPARSVHSHKGSGDVGSGDVGSFAYGPKSWERQVAISSPALSVTKDEVDPKRVADQESSVTKDEVGSKRMADPASSVTKGEVSWKPTPTTRRSSS
ncbi:hypothetical protein IE81DRAFT_369265 [Ceraceosorus guamensis]|uniref:Uncharacterized protein n=1 Tax=Ceraceosorus guamensis TaxID=1522189 RepID=A0A316VQ64_9BASI|nr:hypothetical protein IE81DRAFT_369265 [Ceraceosorus guamensis]PWN39208.1 hypothetical protein IE81DRAFT_369265 [Ceraceosorus guamensis]